MAWQDDLQPASWRGVPFYVETASTRGGRNTAVHAYCRAALRWLVTDRVAQAVDVQTSWQGSTLAIAVLVTQATGSSRFSFVWGQV